MVIRLLTPELQEKAKNELGEEPSRIANDLVNIREWLATQHHLQCRTDDQWLISFLRSCKYNIESTKMKIDNFYRMRTLMPEFFENRDPFQFEIQEVLKAGLLLPLPICSETAGPRIILVRFNGISQKDDNFGVAGVLGWVDCEAYPLSYIFQVTPYFLKRVVYCFQKSYPIRIKASHFLNAILGFETIFNLMKTFMPKKLKDRFFVYNKNSSKELNHVLDQKYLPEQYGGTNGDINELTEYWKSKIESYRDWFIEDGNYRSSENLRSKTSTTANISSILGSFNPFNSF